VIRRSSQGKKVNKRKGKGKLLDQRLISDQHFPERGKTVRRYKGEVRGGGRI